MAPGKATGTLFFICRIAVSEMFGVPLSYSGGSNSTTFKPCANSKYVRRGHNFTAVW